MKKQESEKLPAAPKEPLSLKKLLTNGIVSSVILVAVGAVLIAYPNQSLDMICLIVGWALAAAAVIRCAVLAFHKRRAAREKREDAAWTSADFLVAARSLVVLVVGVVLLVRTETIVNALPLVIGVAGVIIGAVNTVQALTARSRVKLWLMPLVCAALLLVVGILVATDPFGDPAALVCLMGVTLIMVALSNLLNSLLLKKKKEPDAKA